MPSRMGFSPKRTKKGFSQRGDINGTKVTSVVARNSKGKKFAVIKINGKLSPTISKKMLDSVSSFTKSKGRR